MLNLRWVKTGRRSKHLLTSVLLLSICLVAFGCITQSVTGIEPALSRTSGLIGASKPWQTPYYCIDSGQGGPTVMIVGGIHGDEPSGPYAADQIRHWPITSGKLIVIPRANVLALTANKRLTPGEPNSLYNLNRNFPKHDEPKDAARSQPGKSIWSLVNKHHPDWLIDLHEGFDFCISNPDSVGSSIIAFPNAETKMITRQMIDTVNETISDPDRKMVLLKMPIDGSLARAAGEHLNIKSMIVETTSRKQALSIRVRQHRIMVHCLLSYLKMTDCAADTLIPPAGVSDKKQRLENANTFVAIYNGPGTGLRAFKKVAKTLDGSKKIITQPIGPHEIQTGCLDQFDVVIFPGGTGMGQANGIGENGRAMVRQFVKDGGGYIGICAGTYLAANNYKWSLKIINVTIIDTQHWRRGKGIVKIELTESGRKIIADREGLVDIYYANGPLLGPAGADDLPEYDVLAYFRSDMAKNVPGGVMPNTPAIIAAQFEQGRVICLSPHAESTKGLGNFILCATQWVSTVETKPLITGQHRLQPAL